MTPLVLGLQRGLRRLVHIVGRRRADAGQLAAGGRFHRWIIPAGSHSPAAEIDLAFPDAALEEIHLSVIPTAQWMRRQPLH
jgi:hypothetical protein